MSHEASNIDKCVETDSIKTQTLEIYSKAFALFFSKSGSGVATEGKRKKYDERERWLDDIGLRELIGLNHKYTWSKK